MGNTTALNSPNGKKAAVVVIDNQFGLLGGVVTADAANEVWQQITAGLLTPYYDEIIIITGHYPNAAHNPIVSALQSATARFGRVDMFTDMHTNMIRAENMFSLSMERSLAQLPFKVWTDALNPEQRSHLRLLYSMGCDDGNDIAANAARELGFKTYVGHEGSASNVIATYPLLARWMEGESIRNAANQTNAEMSRCLPQVGELFESHRTEITSAITTFLDCNRAAGGGKKTPIKTTPRDEKSVAVCIDAASSTLTPIGLETALMTASCISTANEAFSHIQDPTATVRELFASADGKLEEVAGYSNDRVLEEFFPKNFQEKLTQEANRMKLVVYGSNIRFNDTPKAVPPLPQSEEIKQLVAIVMQDAVRKEFSMKSTMLAAAALDRLRELRAKMELSSIAGDKRVPPGMQLEAATCLVKLGDFSALRKIAFIDGGNEFVCGRLYRFGDKAYLRRLLHDAKTSPKLRHILAELFVKKGEPEAIKGLGRFFAKYGAGAVSIEALWKRAKEDAVFAKDFQGELVIIMSHGMSWLFGDTSIFFEMADQDPQLLVKTTEAIAVGMTARPVALREDAKDDEQIYFLFFAIALLFDKGKISTDDAKGILALSKMSQEEILRFSNVGTVNGFNPAPVIRKILGVE